MEIPESVRAVLRRLTDAGFSAYCVGGCVRDSLMGRSPEDWDAATSARPEEVLALFGPKAFPTGLKHGTVTVRSLHRSVEVTTFRRDGTYSDHRRPDVVAFTDSLSEDLLRRDFTVNAMALGLDGALRDPWGGAADLQQRRLRCVGVPEERFREDALRVMRGLRFASTLDFTIEEETAAALRRAAPQLREIAVERIQAELLKLLKGPGAARVLRDFPEVIGVFWPEILDCVGFEQHNRHHIYDVWEHSLHALEQTPPDVALRCAALLHDVGKPPAFTLDASGVGHFYGHGARSRELAERMLHRLKCAAAFQERVVRLVEWHDRLIPCTDRGVRRALRALGEEELRLLILLKRADNLAQAPEYRSRQAELDAGEAILERLLAEDACFSLRQLAVNGRDLTALGLSGPAVGRTLEYLLNQVLDGALPNEREALLDAAKNHEQL